MRGCVYGSLAVLLLLTPVRGTEIQVQIQGNAQQIQIVPAFGNNAALLPPQAAEQLKLTAEQKDKVARIESEFQEKQKAAAEKFQQAIQNKDRQAIQQASAEQAKVRADALTQVEAVLSDEQKKTLGQIKQQQNLRPFAAPAPVGGAVLPPAIQDRLRLSDEQKKKIDELQKELEAKILGVLTEEQKKQYEEMKKSAANRPAIQLRLQ